jgi:CheY-like chemotaxis protein
MTDVLVVDDEPGMVETLRDILSSAGYTVSTAGDGTTALEQIARHHYAVVVMDVRMPGADGVEVAQRIGPPPPAVILMTAFAVEERLAAARACNVRAVLHKPFSASYLLDLVAQAVPA